MTAREDEVLSGKGGQTVPISAIATGASGTDRPARRRVDAERALRESEDRYRALVEASGQIVWTTPPNGLVEDMPLWRTFTGQTVEEVHGLGWLDALHPDDRGRVRQQWATAVAGRMLFESEYRVRRHDGVYRSFLCRAVPVFHDGGSLREWVGALTDITERQQAQEELARAQQELTAQFTDMTRLIELTERLAAGRDLPTMLREVLAAVVTLQQTDMGVVTLLDPERNDLDTVASIGLSQEYLDLVGRVPMGIGACGAAATERLPIVVKDTDRDLRFAPYREAAQVAGYRAVYSVPLITLGGELLGTIATYFRQPCEPNERHQHLVVLYARVAAELLERTRLYEVAQRARSELAAIFDALVDAVAIYDAEGRMVHANAAARRLFGIRDDRHLDRYRTLPLAERVRQQHMRNEHGQPLKTEDWPLWRMLRGDVLTGSKAVDLQLRGPGGRAMLVNVSGAPMRDAEKRIIGAVCICRDVTERRRLEQRTHATLDALLALAEILVSEPSTAPADTAATAERMLELTRSVVGCRRVSITSIDPDTELLNPVAVAGLTPELERIWRDRQSYGTPLHQSLSPELRQALRAGEVLVLDLREPQYRDLPNPYGIGRLVIAPMRLGERLIGLLALDDAENERDYTSEEITLAGAIAKLAALVLERGRLVREREDAHARELALRETNRQMDEFLSIASHELRTPLTSIRANVQLTVRRLTALFQEEERLTPERLESVQSLLERANRQTQLLDRLVGDLLDVSRIQANRLELRMERCDLIGIVRDAVVQQRMAWPGRPITLKTPNRRVPVVADADRIGQVVANYLTNALKYSAAEKPVHVTLDLHDATARVAVRDAGPGLTPEQQRTIWDRFQRVEEIQVQAGSGVGLGLGLYITKTIVERHGGQVGVESTPGDGSMFWFTLPVATRG
jgi:PAS domain S-box-containing protein